jgi:hypothetical protein
LATTAQVLAAVVAVVFTWQAFRARNPQRLAVLCCAALLANPHVSNYDLILAAIASFLALQAVSESSSPRVLMLPLLAWLAPLYNPPRATPLGLITPLLLLGLMLMLQRRPRQS